jgi:hypothetical protein
MLSFAKKQHAVSIFFDLEKAYDTTLKYGILKDLFDMECRFRKMFEELVMDIVGATCSAMRLIQRFSQFI